MGGRSVPSNFQKKFSKTDDHKYKGKGKGKRKATVKREEGRKAYLHSLQEGWPWGIQMLEASFGIETKAISDEEGERSDDNHSLTRFGIQFRWWD